LALTAITEGEVATNERVGSMKKEKLAKILRVGKWNSWETPGAC